MRFLVIDQHAGQLTVSLRNEDGDVILSRQVSNQPDKVNFTPQDNVRENRVAVVDFTDIPPSVIEIRQILHWCS